MWCIILQVGSATAGRSSRSTAFIGARHDPMIWIGADVRLWRRAVDDSSGVSAALRYPSASGLGTGSLPPRSERLPMNGLLSSVDRA